MTEEKLAAALDECGEAMLRLRKAVENYPRFAAVGEAHEELRMAKEEYDAAHRAYQDAVKTVLGDDEEGGS